MDDRLFQQVTVDFSGPGHFDRDESKPCRRGDGPTRMRDHNGEPCHESCRAEELTEELYGPRVARQLVDERFGPAGETAQEV